MKAHYLRASNGVIPALSKADLSFSTHSGLCLDYASFHKNRSIVDKVDINKFISCESTILNFALSSDEKTSLLNDGSAFQFEKG